VRTTSSWRVRAASRACSRRAQCLGTTRHVLVSPAGGGLGGGGGGGGGGVGGGGGGTGAGLGRDR
jgi:hypothetical protein